MKVIVIHFDSMNNNGLFCYRFFISVNVVYVYESHCLSVYHCHLTVLIISGCFCYLFFISVYVVVKEYIA